MNSLVKHWMTELTLEERCRLLGGASTWRTYAIDRLGIPAIKMSDGPNGVRGESIGSKRTPGVAIPVGIAIGASWDTDLALELGDVLGKEAIRKRTHVVLGPTINLQRSPIGGRTFECISEDPELTALIATNIVRGIQRHDVAVTVKHFVGNDTERDRHNVDVRIDERTMREMYLRPFEATVIDGGAWGLMSAYNRVDGDHCSHNDELLLKVLRNEWGFDGVVVSDWFGSHDTARSAHAGLDIAMPGPKTIYGARLVDAVNQGDVSVADLDTRVEAVLKLVERTRASERSVDDQEYTVDDPTERALCRRASAAGTVLVRNVDNVLPLQPEKLHRIALLGPNARMTRTQGGGSSSMQALSRKSILRAATDRFGEDRIIYEAGVSIDKMAPVASSTHLRTPSGERGLQIDYYNGGDLNGEIVHTDTISSSLVVFFGSCPIGVNPDHFSIRITGSFIPNCDGQHQISFIITGPGQFSLNDQLIVDDPLGILPRSDEYFGLASQEQISTHELRAGDAQKLDITMTTREGFAAVRLGVRPPDDADAMARAVRAAANADVAIVVVGTNDEWETEGHDRETIQLPGEQNELIRRVNEVAKRSIVVVNAGSPVAMPWLEEVDAVVIPFFGGMEMADALIDILCGDSDPGGRLPITYPRVLSDSPAWAAYMPVNGVQSYGEGLLMGYRGHLASGVEPLLPFGFGLSYGDVDWGSATATMLSSSLPTCRVTLPLTNISSRQATVVVQCYVRRVDSHEQAKLGGWHKCLLNAREQRVAMFDLPWIAFRRWDVDHHSWVVEAGDYEISIAKSCAEVCQQVIVIIDSYEIGPSLKHN